VVSVRSLLTLWVSLSMAILGYAYLDLTLTPGLHLETGFSIHVDFERAGELLHWGGRLLNEGAVGLLVFNAIVLGGFVALVALWLSQLGQRALCALRRREPAEEPRVTTTVAFGSVPPPAG